MLCGGVEGEALYHTADGGDHWSPMEAPSFQLCRCGTRRSIVFTTPQDGWFAGAPTGPWVTHDGGKTWRATQTNQGASSSPTDWVAKVLALDVSHGWAVSGDSLLGTDDGGASWSRIYPPSPAGVSVSSSTGEEQRAACLSIPTPDANDAKARHVLNLRVGKGLVCWQDIALETYYKVVGK